MASAVYRRIVIGLLLLFCGCTTPMYTRRDGGALDPDQFRRDSYRCIQESRVTYQGGGYGIGGAVALGVAASAAQTQANRLGQLCMEAAGYRRMSDEEVNAALAHGATPIR